jgi:hypothetical protein
MKESKKAITCLMAVGLITMAAAITASAASAPPSKLVLRPLTPGDVTNYKLPSTIENSGGLNTVGVGTAVYLDAEIPNTTNSVTVTWAATNSLGQAITLADSPLGTNVPVYEPSDVSRYQVAGRKLLRPDMTGQYIVVATIATNGVTQAKVTQTITSATYKGINTCVLCHSGSVAVTNEFQFWQTTAHAMIFSNGISGYLGSYSASCLKCHTVGYDTTASAAPDNGFYSVMQQTGWTFPTTLSPTNWAAMPPTLQNLGNIQCENCHGPGSEHASSLGNTNFITKTVNSGDCNQCHDAPTHHVKGTEWYVSRHALTTGPSSVNCLPCHSADGFIDRRSPANTNYAIVPTPNSTFAPISCQACHEPHGDTVPADNPHLIRAMGAVTMPDGTVVTNAGEGAVCLACHQNRNGSAATQLVNYPLGQPTWFGGSSFGAHDNPQGDMIEGINANTYGQAIPSSAHRYAVTNLCVGCHMQSTTTTDPAFLKAGGHTFNMSYTVVTNGVTNSVDKVDVCVQCHGPIDSFDMVRGDYNGDGVTEGVQTEVQHLLDKVNTLLPNSTYQANSNNYVADGIVKSSISVKTNWPPKFLKAAYNWQFVNNDGSLGVHNAPFAVGILKASIADLTGDANNDGLPDWWQIQYFGSINNPQAAPNAAPAGDGVPNWLKYSSGLDPLVAGVPMTGGYVFGPSLVNPLGTNAVAIYTAAEVTFNTQVGTTYQIQSISALGDSWQNVGGSIAGTGGSIRYLTQTRDPKQQFFRVVHTP